MSVAYHQSCGLDTAFALAYDNLTYWVIYRYLLDICQWEDSDASRGTAQVPEHALLLLGTPVWEWADTTLSIPSQKGQALLWYCAAQPQRMFTRAHVAGLLWGTFSETDSRNSLNTTLTRLRRMVPILPLRFSGDLIGWDPLSLVHVDAHLFLELTGGLSDSAAVPGTRLRDHMDSAMALWRGSFLEGIDFSDADGFMQWLAAERQAWDRRVLRVLERAVGIYEVAGIWHTVIDRAHTALSIDLRQERFHRAIMLAYQRIGDRAAALGQYAVCRDVLRSELGVEPTHETTALADQILGRPSRDTVAWPAVDATTPAALEAAAALTVEDPFIGREMELQSFLDHLADAQPGLPIGVMVSGEPGIGKTRFTAEAAAALKADGSLRGAAWVVLQGECHEDFRSLPFSPFAHIIGAAVGQIPEHILSEHAVDLAPLTPLVPSLRRILSPALHQLPSSVMADDQRSLLEAMAHLLDLIPAPSLIVIDDLHNADPSSLMLVSYLLRHRPSAPFAVLMTARSTQTPPEFALALRRLQRDARLHWIDLGRLSPSAVEQLSEAHLGNEPISAAGSLHSMTGGNPFFLLQTLHALGALPAAAREAGSLPISDEARSLVADRLGRLPPDKVQLLEALSIFPRGGDFEVVARVAGLSEDQALSALDALLTSQLVEEQAEPDSSRAKIVFSHGLCRYVVLDSLSRARIIVMHRAAFSAITAGCAPDELVTSSILEAVFHATRANLSEQADKLRASAAARGLSPAPQ